MVVSNISETKERLEELIELAKQGEDVYIARRKTIIAKLEMIEEEESE